MSTYSVVRLPSLTITAAGTLSNILRSTIDYSDAAAICIYTPATLDAVVFTIDVNPDPDATAAGAGWVTFQTGDPYADASEATVSKARVYFDLPAVGAFRIKAASAVAADRVFALTKHILLA